MSAELIAGVMADINDAYESVFEPKFFFAAKRYGRHGYHELIDRLCSVCAVEDRTDLNDDVAVMLYLSQDSSHFLLMLSLVGRYACFYKGGRPRSDAEIGAEGFAGEVARLVRASGIRILGPELLILRVPFCGESRPTASLYQLLFSDDEEPWVHEWRP